MAIYVFDLDGTLCQTERDESKWDYENATPFPERIKKVNELFEEGHTIIIDSARGCTSGFNWEPFTIEQLKNFGLKFHQVRTGKKFGGDYFIDDKGTNAIDFFEK